MAERSLSLRFAPTFENVDRAREAVRHLCREQYPHPGAAEPVGDLLLAVAEAMNNAVEHSRAEEVEVEVAAGDRSLVFRMLTKGEPFDPTVGVSFPDLDAPEGLPEGGFGRALMSSLADRVSYDYLGGKNVLTLEKMLTKEGNDGN